ncbi:hypothetical protein MPSEU_001076800 [Mayamaea pseudoterrestris]|nr:hypothetical protein MPSEU_001076800 [Mayamaea pseudoterrestris]
MMSCLCMSQVRRRMKLLCFICIVLSSCMPIHSAEAQDDLPFSSHHIKREDYIHASSLLLQRIKGPSSQAKSARHLQTATANTPSVFSVKCRMTVVDFLYANLDAELSQRVEQVGCIPLDYESHAELDLVLVMEIPEAVYRLYRHGINSGTIQLLFDHVMLSDNEETLILLDDVVTEIDDTNGRSLLVAPPPTKGTMSVFLVRISTSDAAPNRTLAEIESRLFNSTLPNFASQYKQCSMEQLQWTLAGGMDILVDVPIANFSTGMSIVTLAESYLRLYTGVTSVSELATRVMYCVAPGTSVGWIASASVNHWRAIFNDEWCVSLSGTMHELGHTLGLLHSGEDDNKYGDQTGYMGYGSMSDTTPQKCFNGFQSWQMGWYANREKYLDVFSEFGVYNLVGFVEYPLVVDGEYVLMIIDDTYFLQYNLAEGFNVDTTEKQNEVTITMPEGAGTGIAGSLAVGANFTVPNYKESGLDLIVEACSVRNASTTGLANAMVIAVGLGRSYCSESQTVAPQVTAATPPVCMESQSPCFEDANCCETLICRGVDDLQKSCTSCRPLYSLCQDTPDCCDGLSCSLGVCREAVVQTPLAANTTSSQVTTVTSSVQADKVTSCIDRKLGCTDNVDCCGDLRCIKVVQSKCRICRRANMQCFESDDCCDGLHCNEKRKCQQTPVANTNPTVSQPESLFGGRR